VSRRVKKAEDKNSKGLTMQLIFILGVVILARTYDIKEL
jgi:hypothetical protein